MASEAEILRLAQFMSDRDARIFGAEFEPGVFRPTWEERGLIGQDAYLGDARFVFEAVETIQRNRQELTQ